MAAIVFDPAQLGTELQALEGKDAKIKINGIDLPNAVQSITAVGWSKEGSVNYSALGRATTYGHTDGVATPRDPTMTIYKAYGGIIKQIIAPDGNWLNARFQVQIQFDNSASATLIFPALSFLPTLTWTLDKCSMQGEEMAVETGGAATMLTWPFRPTTVTTPSGRGFTFS